MKKAVFVFLALFSVKAIAADVESASANSCPSVNELTNQKMQIYGMTQEKARLAAAKTYLAQAKRCHELQRAQGVRGSQQSAKEKYLRSQASALVAAQGSVTLQPTAPQVPSKDAAALK